MAVKNRQQDKAGLSLADITEAVSKDAKAQLNVEARLAASDERVAYELIAVAIYKAMRRRGVDHVKALKSTEELIYVTDIKVVIR